MGAAKKLEYILEPKKQMPLSGKLFIGAISLVVMCFLGGFVTMAISWYQSPIRAEMLSKMDKGEMEKPLLWFLL